MERWSVSVLLFAVALLALPLTGCSGLNKDRSPEEWLSLSYAGLTGVDQYMYTGSLRIFAENGIEFVPQTFEGKVIDHKQLNIQTSSEDPLLMNPVKALERLSRANSGAKVVTKEQTRGSVTLLITESGEASHAEWSALLNQRMEQLADKGPLEEGKYKEEWNKEFAASKEQLDEMLRSLTAETTYELVIDRNRLLPLKLEEHTLFNYSYKDQPRSENRHTSVRFQSFDGAASKAVQ